MYGFVYSRSAISSSNLSLTAICVDTPIDETNNPTNTEVQMKRFVLSVLALAFMFGLLGSTAAAAQGYSPKFPKIDPPKTGAWWYTGSTPPPLLDGHPDMTGVWYGGSSADLSKDTIKGQEM